MRARSLRHLAPLVAVIALATACAQSQPDLALHTLEVLQGAALLGQLTEEDGCLFVIDDRGTRYGMAWPSGRTEWDPATQVIIVGEDAAHVGDRVGVGGVAREPTSEVVGQIDWEQPPSNECLGEKLWLAFGITTDLSNLE